MAEKNIDELSFEDAIKDLTGIVDGIEKGDTALQSSIEQYEKGMKLIAHCRSILQEAERKIEKISDSESDK